MTAMTAEDWLASRLEGAPPDLAAAVMALLDEDRRTEAADADGSTPAALDEIPARLAAAALRGFDAVVDESASERRSRATALRLLAADAALTYAFEAAVDLDGDAALLAERLGPHGAIGRLLEEGETS